MTEPEQIELARARVESARATELKERILMTVAHEVKGTLSTILLWESVLRGAFDQPDLRVRALDAIRQTATAQAEAVSELSQLARLLSGAIALERKRFPIEVELITAIELQAAVARVRAIDVRLDVRGPLGFVYADQARVRRAIEVLVQTRIRATTSGGGFTVAARRNDEAVTIIVGDVDIDSAIDETVTMLDLPLVVVGEVLALHGGSLDAARPIGGGPLTFWIRIPATSPT